MKQQKERINFIKLKEKNNWSYRGIAESLSMTHSSLIRFCGGGNLDNENINKIRKLIEGEI